MPKKHYMPFKSKLHAIGLVDGAKKSLRNVSMMIGTAKSTLHDNLKGYRKDIASFEKHQQRSERALAEDILLVSFQGKTSSRDCAGILSRQKSQNITHQKVLSMLSEVAVTANKKNSETLPLKALATEESPLLNPLSAVGCGVFDEIFQKKLPILGFVDPVSAFVHLEAAPDRSEESWSKFLVKLKSMGLDPESIVTDGGKGMLKSISTVFPKAVRVRDLFHVLEKLSKALKALEGYCYRLLVAYDKLVKKSVDQEKQENLQSKLNKAILLYDALNNEVTTFHKACYFENNNGYVSSSQTKVIISRIIALIDCASRNGIKHRALKEARSYLKGAKEDIVAYKATVEKIVESQFGSVSLDVVLGYVCPIIEFLDQIQRSYENRRRTAYWTEKLVEARKKFRQFDFINQEEVDKAIDMVAATLGQIKKSSSIIEAINSVVRRFLVTYKSIPSWFCPIFTFYWNHRRFSRGKRKGLEPKEILTGEYFGDDWIDALLKDHIFLDEKCLSSVEIPAAKRA